MLIRAKDLIAVQVVTVIPSGGIDIEHITYLLQLYTVDIDGGMTISGSSIDGQPDRNYTQVVYGSGYASGFENGKMTEFINYPEGDTLPPPIEVESAYLEGESDVQAALMVHFYRIPRITSSFPSWVKDTLIDSNIRTNNSDKKIDFIIDTLIDPSITSSIKSLLKDNVKYVFDNSDGTKESLQLLEDYSRVNTQLNLIDTGLDAWSLIREAIADVIELITDYLELSRLDRMEKRENEIKDLLTDEEKLNKLLGDALNVGSPEAQPVVKFENGFYNFGKFWGYLDGSQNLQFVSKDIKESMPLRDWRSDLI